MPKRGRGGRKRVRFAHPSEKLEEEEEEDDVQEIVEEEEDEEGESDEEEEVRDIRQMVLQQNRKKKKSGGFQSMGECASPPSLTSRLRTLPQDLVVVCSGGS